MTRRRAGDALRFDYSQFESLAKLIPDVGETIRPEDDDVEMLRIIRDQLKADGYGSLCIEQRKRSTRSFLVDTNLKRRCCGKAKRGRSN